MLARQNKKNGPYQQSAQKNKISNQINNNKRSAWQEARVFAQILRSLALRRIKYAVFLMKATPKKRMEKLNCLQKIYRMKTKMYFYDILERVTSGQKFKTNKQINRVSIPSIMHQKISKIYTKKCRQAFLRLLKTARHNKRTVSTLQMCAQNCSLLSNVIEEKFALTSILQKMNKMYKLQNLLAIIDKSLNLKMKNHLGYGFMAIYQKALKHKTIQIQVKQRQIRSEVVNLRNQKNQEIAEEKKKMNQIKSLTERLQMEKYQKESHQRREKALQQGQKRVILREHNTEIEELQSMSVQLNEYYGMITQIRQNRELLHNISQVKRSALEEYGKTYEKYSQEEIHLGNKFQLIKQKMKQHIAQHVSYLEHFTEYHIHKGLKLHKLINQYENVDLTNDKKQNQAYLQALEENQALKGIIRGCIKSEMLKNKREAVDGNAYELQEMFQQLFNYLDISDCKSTTQTGYTNGFRDVGRCSIESYQSYR